MDFSRDRFAEFSESKIILYSTKKKMHTPGAGISGYALLLTVQIIFLIVYAVFVRYDDSLLPKNVDDGDGEEDSFEKKHVPSYPRKLFIFILF